jgi:LmbE family N-acetylglucosaminyl deacetylase
MVTTIDGAGTDETVWLGWPAPDAWPRLALTIEGPPLVVAPHPDDEILGVGGLLALLGDAEVVAVTDGEASHPDSTVYKPAELAEIRCDETRAALDRLGLTGAPVHHLGHPDGGIDQHALTATLTGLLTPGRWCLATWRGDGHPDHEAVGRAAAAACAATGARLLEYPIWAWHWATPNDDRVPWQRAHRIELTAGAQAAKAAAIQEFTSQIMALGPEPGDAPILPPHVLDRFARPFEMVLI